MKNFFILKICICALISLSSFNSYAADGTVKTDILVTATVTSSCTIDAQNVAFGEYIPTVKDAITAEGLIKLTCVKGSAPVVAIGGGANQDGTNRRAAYIPANSADQRQIEYLTYELYQPESKNPGSVCPTSFANAKIWSSTTDTSNSDNTTTFATTPAPSNVAREYKICGFMKGGQDVGAGIYKDTVTISASF